MKSVLIAMFLSLSANAFCCQNFELTKLDQKLISLWMAANNIEIEKLSGLFMEVEKEYVNLYLKLNETQTPHFNEAQFEKYTTTILHVLKRYVQKSNTEKVKFFSIELLFENYGLRTCLSNEKYPLDDFLILFESYESVYSIVNDPMMDLLEWFEFMQLVTLMVDNWEIYDCKPFEEINNFFPGITEKEHDLQKEIANQCLTRFTDSLKSGFQNEFEIPCDDFGVALSNIFKLYGND